MSSEAMNLALEALEKLVRFESDSWELGSCRIAGQATKALREALAEQPAQQEQEPICKLFGTLPVYDRAAQQEPVAYGMWDTMLGKGNRMMMVRLDRGQDGCTVPLYTSPPAQRTWVGLTDEEIEEILADHIDDPYAVAFTVNHKLKEKNNGN